MSCKLHILVPPGEYCELYITVFILKLHEFIKVQQPTLFVEDTVNVSLPPLIFFVFFMHLLKLVFILK